MDALSSCPLFPRQHRRSDRKLPGHGAHRLEGLPAAAVLPAGDRSLCGGGSRSFPKETRAKQEVLLKGARGERAPPYQRGLICSLPATDSALNVFCEDCTECLYGCSAALGAGHAHFLSGRSWMNRTDVTPSYFCCSS